MLVERGKGKGLTFHPRRVVIESATRCESRCFSEVDHPDSSVAFVVYEQQRTADHLPRKHVTSQKFSEKTAEVDEKD